MRTTIFCKIPALLLICAAAMFFSKPCIALEITPKVINLGDISKNSILKQTLSIKNNESQAIILEKARSSCECISIKYEKGRQIQKDEVYLLNLDMDTTGLNIGKFRKFIFFHLKNSKTPVISIEIKGNIL